MALNDYGPTRQPSPSPDNAQLGNAAVTDPAAITYAAPSTTVGSDIAAFTDPPSAAEMALLRTFVNALKTDVAAMKVALAADAADVAAVRTKLIALLTSLENATPNPLLPT